jgi:hypothetical protein
VQINCTEAFHLCVIKVKRIIMIVYCKECKLPLTKELKEYTGKSFGQGDGQPFIQPGYYAVSCNISFSDIEKKIVINIEDLLNTINHTNPSRLNGCCGLDGGDGPNKICLNGHEVATEKSDCWMPHEILFENDKTIAK